MKKIKIIFLNIAKYFFIFRLTRFLTRKYPRILCYHGGSISDESDFNSLLFMKKDFFNKRIIWLMKNKFIFHNLNDLTKNPENCVCLTFDDGWYSTFSELLPILNNYKIPSTLYLSTHYYEQQAPIIPVVISYISFKAQKEHVNLKEIDSNFDGFFSLKTKSGVHQLINYIEDKIKASSNNDQINSILSKIAHLADISPASLDLASRRFSFVTKDELLEIKNSHCAIELHGHKHHYPLNSPQEFEKDLTFCIKKLQEELNISGRHYCYPSGSFDEHAKLILPKFGVQTATTCIPGLVDNYETQRYYLPRFLDGKNITDIEFEAEMMGFNYFLRKFFKK